MRPLLTVADAGRRHESMPSVGGAWMDEPSETWVPPEAGRLQYLPQPQPMESRGRALRGVLGRLVRSVVAVGGE
jgi:hypothetical protein